MRFRWRNLQRKQRMVEIWSWRNMFLLCCRLRQIGLWRSSMPTRSVTMKPSCRAPSAIWKLCAIRYFNRVSLGSLGCSTRPMTAVMDLQIRGVARPDALKHDKKSALRFRFVFRYDFGSCFGTISVRVSYDFGSWFVRFRFVVRTISVRGSVRFHYCDFLDILYKLVSTLGYAIRIPHLGSNQPKFSKLTDVDSCRCDVHSRRCFYVVLPPQH